MKVADSASPGTSTPDLCQGPKPSRVNGDGAFPEDEDGEASVQDAEDEDDDGKPLSDLLIRDLTGHRTLGLRLALGEQPDIARNAAATRTGRLR